MKSNKNKWSKKDYKEFLAYLISLKDDKYQKFHSNLTATNYEIIGIRVPIMRIIAKQIAEENYESFLEPKKYKYYEEIFIRGIVISYIKDKNKLIDYMNDFVKLIDNWAICDSFCNSLKIIKNDLDYFWSTILKYIKSNEEFVVRVGLILILNYYINDSYIDEILNILNNIKTDKYYINMAIAWNICEIYIKQKEKCLIFLKNNNLNKFTQNKAISKIRDSYRISKEEKEFLISFKK